MSTWKDKHYGLGSRHTLGRGGVSLTLNGWGTCAVHPGMAAGTERHQLGVVAGAAAMHIQIVSGVTAAASPAVALESRIPVPSKETRRIPPTPVMAMHSPATAGVPCPQEQTRNARSPAATTDGGPRGGVSLLRPEERSASPGEWSGCSVSGLFGGSDTAKKLSGSIICVQPTLCITCARYSKK